MVNINFDALIKVIDPEDNQTGGGAACAVAGAMAAALVGMVARLSTGRKGMPHSDDFYRLVDTEAQKLTCQLMAGSVADSQAFESVMQAYRMPKEPETRAVERKAAIQAALIEATQTPLTNAEKNARIVELCIQLEGSSNPNAASDLECARLLAHAALMGCLSNARVNLPSIKDSVIASELDTRLQDLTSRARGLGDAH